MTSSDSTPAVEKTPPRKLVVCLDGTTNEPEIGFTNVARMFDVASKSPEQLVYYDPGVGTMGTPAAIMPWGKALTRAAGMIAGYGIRDNIEQAYTCGIYPFDTSTCERTKRITRRGGRLIKCGKGIRRGQTLLSSPSGTE
jgi:uncharacterized protein (DUF2235 family)